MKIFSPNLFSATNQLQLLNELNLKEGQKVVGRISSLDDDGAVLELAGRFIQAKIEGDLPPTGTSQTFVVKIDEQGRIILKVHQNLKITDSERVKANKVMEDVSGQKKIIAALMKDGLPPSNDNVVKVTRYLQDFQTKYQQPVDAKVFTFIMAQKWPVTPAMILTSMVYQEPEVRDQLWNKLQKILMKQDAGETFLSQLNLKMQSNVPEIIHKLKSLAGKNILETTMEPAITASNHQTQTKRISKLLTEDNPKQEKELESILEQNIALNKAILKETAVGGLYNLVPLLISDSQSGIHECMVRWKVEKDSDNSVDSDQIVYMTIPTDNLGDINMILRSGPRGTRINLRVSDEEVRKYLLKNTSAMKAALAEDNAKISISLTENEELNLKTSGVDLWM